MVSHLLYLDYSTLPAKIKIHSQCLIKFCKIIQKIEWFNHWPIPHSLNPFLMISGLVLRYSNKLIIHLAPKGFTMFIHRSIGWSDLVLDAVASGFVNILDQHTNPENFFRENLLQPCLR